MKNVLKKNYLYIVVGICCVVLLMFFGNFYYVNYMKEKYNKKIEAVPFSATSSDLNVYFPAYFPKQTNAYQLPTPGDVIILEKKDSNGIYHYGLIDTGPNNWNINGTSISTIIINYLNEKFRSHNTEKVRDWNGTTGTVQNKYVLDFLLITHNHEDHIGNALTIADTYKIKTLYIKQFDKDTVERGNYDVLNTYAILLSKIFDQNSRVRNGSIPNGMISKVVGADDLIYASKYCKTPLDNSVTGYKNTPDVCRLMMNSDNTNLTSKDYRLGLFAQAKKGVDFEPWSSSNRNINFYGAILKLYNVIDNELNTKEYLGNNYSNYSKNCPYYPYYPDYWDKTGSKIHSSEVNRNYSNDPAKKNYSNYYAKYNNGIVPSENTRSIAMLIKNGNQYGLVAGDLMNEVRYRTVSEQDEVAGVKSFVYCGYEDALASAIAKEITGDVNGNISLAFVKANHHGFWYSNTINYMRKINPKNMIITNKSQNENSSSYIRNNEIAKQVFTNQIPQIKSASGIVRPYGNSSTGIKYNSKVNKVYYTGDATKDVQVRMATTGRVDIWQKN